jgi:RNA polymerase sigma-70 factor, ECF subfamily
MMASSVEISSTVDALYATESRRILATLIRLLGDFDRAEDAMQDAFRAALEQWPRDGIPAQPRTWLISTGRFKAIDALRRAAKFETPLADVADRLAADANSTLPDEIADDQLRLIFTCCHPALPDEQRAALTLREVCGLSTEAIAHAFLTSPATLAQRIVRAKARIREARIAYEIPAGAELPARLDAVLQVVYLVFNEGYAASSGVSLTRADLCGEAIRLGRLLVELLPEAETHGLLALMLLHESRRAARSNAAGELVPIEDQDRARWDRAMISEGLALAQRAMSAQEIGLYTLQAAIAATHASAPDMATTDWTQIVDLYDLLLQAAPSSVVQLNRAVATAMRDGPEAGLSLIDAILARGELPGYHLAHAARADLLRRLVRFDEARAAYRQALQLAQQEPERRYLQRRLEDLPASGE